MKLMTYNIFEGGTGRIDPLAEVIRLAAAEVVVIAEAWHEDNFHRLADRLAMDRFWAGNSRNPKGPVGVMSKRKICEAVNWAELDERITRGAVCVTLEWGGGKLPLVGLHLHARESLADEQIRLTELAALFEWTQKLGLDHILAGDFNASHPQQRIDPAKLRKSAQHRIAPQSNQIPRDAIRRILEHGYSDAHALHHAPENFGTSFTTRDESMRIDYFFLTPALLPRVKSCEIFKPEIARYASDHFPVLMELAES